MSALLPNQTKLLSQVCSDPATLAEAQLNQNRQSISGFLAKSFAFVRANYTHLNAHYVLEFSPAGTSRPFLKFADVLTACATDKPILKVSSDLCVNESTTGGVLISEACAYTSAATALQVVVHGTYLYVILCGQIIQETDVLAPSKRPPIGTVYDRNSQDMPAAINDHFEARVRREKGFKYWHDSSKRELVAEPESTERVFQRSIYLWLEEHILDKLRVYAEPRGMGQDATDVTVVTLAGEHIVEIKWLGKNKNGTEYKHERINEGLRQVAIYLNNDPRAVRGYVLLYDARCWDEHENESTFDPLDRHANCDDPIILFLESDTPSQTAKKKPRGRVPPK